MSPAHPSSRSSFKAVDARISFRRTCGGAARTVSMTILKMSEFVIRNRPIVSMTIPACLSVRPDLGDRRRISDSMSGISRIRLGGVGHRNLSGAPKYWLTKSMMAKNWESVLFFKIVRISSVSADCTNSWTASGSLASRDMMDPNIKSKSTFTRRCDVRSGVMHAANSERGLTSLPAPASIPVTCLITTPISRSTSLESGAPRPLSVSQRRLSSAAMTGADTDLWNWGLVIRSILDAAVHRLKIRNMWKV